MVEIIYNHQSKTEIFRFQKNLIWRRGISLFSSFDVKKVSYTVSAEKYRRAISLIDCGNEQLKFLIDWSKVIMAAPEERFVIKVFYDNDLRYETPVVVKYQRQDITINDLNVTIDNHSAEWGCTDKLCILSINLKDDLLPWMFNKSTLTLNFESNNCHFTFPNNNNKMEVSLSSKIDIPIYYKKYQKAINEELNDNIVIYINGRTQSLHFTFTPRAYSYELKLDRLVESIGYSPMPIDLYKLSFSKKDNLSPTAGNIRISSSQHHDFGNILDIKKSSETEWLVSTKRNLSIGKFFKGIKVNLPFEIDRGKQTFDVNLSIGKEYSNDSCHIRIIEPKPLEVTVSPTNFVTYVEKTLEGTLLICNQNDYDINIDDIEIDELEQGSIKLQDKKSFNLSRKELKRISFKISCQQDFKQNIAITVKSQDCGNAKINIPLQVKKRPIPRVKISLTEANLKLISENSYQPHDSVVSIKIEHTSDSSQESLPIALSDISFQTPFVLSDEVKQKELPYGSSITTDLIVSDLWVIQEESLSKEDHQYHTNINWSYKAQTAHLTVPVIKPHFFEIDDPIYESTEIKFPQSHEEDVVEVLRLHIRQVENNDKIQIWDTEQKLLVLSPFSFKKDALESELSINPDDTVSIYLHIRKIEGITDNTINIAEVKVIPLKVEQICQHRKKSHYPIGKKKPTIIKVNPIYEAAKCHFYFSQESEKVRLHRNRSTEYVMQIPDDDDDTQALYIGNICIENISQIPSYFKKDDSTSYLPVAVRQYVYLPQVITSNNTDITHTKSYKEFYAQKFDKERNASNIEILNGGAPVSFPLYLNYAKWKEDKNDFQIRFKTEQICSGGKISEYCIDIHLKHIYTDDIYSLDLGTTGIVMAKVRNGIPTCLKLSDCSNPIEKEDEILSSNTMIDVNDNVGKILLAPAEDRYYSKPDNGSKKFRLVPSKFIIGQSKIPFLSEFYLDKDVKKDLQVFRLQRKGKNNINEAYLIDFTLTGDKETDENTISDYIESLYRCIMDRCSAELSSINKLVVTYPNTYTIDTLYEIKSILQEKIGLNLDEQIAFVPESDAVAALYFHQKIYEGGFLDTDDHPKPIENVIFYDMGAGTLDLSLVSFETSSDGVNIVATIINKIGIPLAGNYIDYIIYSTLLNKGFLIDKIQEKPNTIKNLTTDIKKVITFGEKRNLSNETWIAKHQTNFINNGATIQQESYDSLFKDALDDFLITCSETVLKCLIPKGTKIDTIVFSGRGSQFAPLKLRVKESLKLWARDNSEIKEDSLKAEGCGDYLKTCVALGALRYQTYFNSNGIYTMVNKNLYSKIAIVYWGPIESGKNDVNVKFLLDPLSADWSVAESINGTYCMDFESNEVIKNCRSDVYYIQTSLDEDSLKELYRDLFQHVPNYSDNLKWAFVNVLSKIRVGVSTSIPIHFNISKNNEITNRVIGNKTLTDTKLLEDVENNILYKRSMWPLIVTTL